MAERVGLGACPVCASPKARYSLSKKQLICVTCDACNVQVFARSDRSDQLLRGLIKTEAAPAAPEPEAPASSSPSEPPAPAAAAPAEAPAVTKKPSRGSFMQW